MKVWKNLFGTNDKIHVDEIAVAPDLLLSGILPSSGSNANGSWIKFHEGTMICSQRWVQETIDASETQVRVRERAQVRNFPQTFVDPPAVSVNFEPGYWRQFEPGTSNFGAGTLARDSTNVAVTANTFTFAYDFTTYRGYLAMSYIAIGRWK